MNKRLAFWAVCLLIPVLLICSGCAGGSGNLPADPTGEPDISGSPAVLELARQGATSYRIVKADGLGGQVISAIISMQSDFKKRTGASISVETDLLAAEVQDYEILVGATNRSESGQVSERLRQNDYAVEVCGSKLILTGGSDEAILKAISWFRKEILDGTCGDLCFSESQNKLVCASYDIDSFRCAGTELRKFTIVVPEGQAVSERWCAAMLQKYLYSHYGFRLPVVCGDRTEYPYEILIGRTARTDHSAGEYEFLIAVSGNKLELVAESMYSYYAMQNYFTGTLASGDISEISLEEGYLYRETVSDSFSSGTEYLLEREGQIRMMFNNIGGQWTPEEDADPALRMSMLAEQYLAYLPDVLALQECSPKCRTGEADIIAMLRKGGYTEAGSGGCTPVLYRQETLELLDWGYSTYQDGMNDSSKSYTWAVFRAKSGGKTFAVCSTHFWWKDEDARVLDARQLIPALERVAAKWNCPVVLGGDFNCTLSARSVRYLIDSGCADVRELADAAERMNTFHAPAEYDKTIRTFTSYFLPSADLDHVLLYGTGLHFRYYDVVTDLYAMLGTDHCPVMTEFDFA